MLGPALLTALVTALALPAPSLAKDPLLSGYGGPGGGEQVLLGSQLTGGGGSGGSGGSSPASAPASGGSATATPGSLRAPTAASGAAASTTRGGGAPAKPAPATNSDAKGHTKHPAGSTTAKPATPPVAVPRQVAYPTRADDVGGFPLSAGDLAVGVLALLAVGGLAVWLRRTAHGGGGPGAQASA